MGYKTPCLKPPTRRGMALLALSVLEDLRVQADAGPIELTDAGRLALGWLMHAEIAQDFQAGMFVEALTTTCHFEGAQPGYLRYTRMYQLIATWRQDVQQRSARQ